MTQSLNRWLPSLTLACWSGILLYFHLSGRLAAFLHPAFRPGVLIAGAVLLAFAIGSAIGSVFGGGNTSCCADGACGHAVRPTLGKLLAFAVLLIPLAVALGTPRNGFGLAAIENRGVSTDAAGITSKTGAPKPGTVSGYVESTPDAFIPKTANGAIAASVIDLLYAAADPSLRGDFEGKRVEIVGQLMSHKIANPHGTRMKVVRMFMTCCAADAKPIAALIELPENQPKIDIPELSWVKVQGKPTFPMEGGRTIAVLKAESVAVTEPPEETMLY